MAGPILVTATAEDNPVLTDYRTLIGGLAQRLYGLDATRLAAVFPQAPAKDLQIV